MKQILLETVSRHGRWDNSGDNESARRALEEFRRLLMRHRPYRSLSVCEGHHFFYIHYLLMVRAALEGHMYERACNRIGSLLHACCQVDNRWRIPGGIRANLLALLEEYL